MTTKARIARLEAEVGAAGLRREAERMAARLRAEGIEVVVEDVLAEMRDIERVTAGCATAEAQAAAIAAHLARDGIAVSVAEVRAELDRVLADSARDGGVHG